MTAPRARRRGREFGRTTGLSLFAETLYAGLLVTVISIPGITLPLGLWLAARHLHRFRNNESARLLDCLRDLRRGWVALVLFGTCASVVVLLCVFGSALSISLNLPGAGIVALLDLAIIVGVVVTVAGVAGTWEPGASLAVGIRLLGVRKAGLLGLWLGLAVLCVAVLAWQMLPMVIPGLGLVALVASSARPLDDVAGSADRLAGAVGDV